MRPKSTSAKVSDWTYYTFAATLAVGVVFSIFLIDNAPPWTLPAVLALAILAGSIPRMLIRRFRTDPDYRRQDDLLKDLWRLSRRAPNQRPLRDPETGRGLHIMRIPLVLTLLQTFDQYEDGGIRNTYALGHAVPRPAPLRRHTDDRTGFMPRIRGARGEERFNDATGALDTSADEIQELIDQLERALDADIDYWGNPLA